jgi:thiol-disulfide isomerase/thioredoxin
MFHVDIIIQEKIAHLFPTIAVEDSPLLHKELNMLSKKDSSESTKDKIHAPELVGISDWLNSKPLTISQLKGKVVLLDFWTYTCINCIRTLPHVTQWYNDYKNKGLEIIGVHTPEFAFEKNKAHVENAIKRFNITYPVALDNDYQTWRAYDNHYWPAHYLIDQNGIIVKTHFGEGDYTEMENAIRALLNLPLLDDKGELILKQPITQETYLGFERADRYQPELHIQANTTTTYQPIKSLSNDHVSLTGSWTVSSDCIRSENNNNALELNFIANRVYIVMQSDKPQLVTVLLDDKPVPQEYYSRDMDADGKIMVHEPRMYEVINLKKDYGRHTLTLQCQKGINAYVFTFGAEDA